MRQNRDLSQPEEGQDWSFVAREEPLGTVALGQSDHNVLEFSILGQGRRDTRTAPSDVTDKSCFSSLVSSCHQVIAQQGGAGWAVSPCTQEGSGCVPLQPEQLWMCPCSLGQLRMCFSAIRTALDVCLPAIRTALDVPLHSRKALDVSLHFRKVLGVSLCNQDSFGCVLALQDSSGCVFLQSGRLWMCLCTSGKLWMCLPALQDSSGCTRSALQESSGCVPALRKALDVSPCNQEGVWCCLPQKCLTVGWVGGSFLGTIPAGPGAGGEGNQAQGLQDQ